MKYYYVNVIVRLSEETACVGAMLTVAELLELVSVLQKYNFTDLIIFKGVENV